MQSADFLCDALRRAVACFSRVIEVYILLSDMCVLIEIDMQLTILVVLSGNS